MGRKRLFDFDLFGDKGDDDDRVDPKEASAPLVEAIETVLRLARVDGVEVDDDGVVAIRLRLKKPDDDE
jgi:hypothetical protein